MGFSEEILLTGSAVQQRMQDGDGNTRGGDSQVKKQIKRRLLILPMPIDWVMEV